MIKFNINILNKIECVTLYHRWDLIDFIVDWATITKDSIGSYVMFDDGSELIVKIIGVNKDAVRTSAGVFRITDIVHWCNPKCIKAGYSGMYGNREHLLVRPLGKQEKGLITRYIGGEKLKKVTPRILAGSRDRAKNELSRQGMSVEEATSLLITIARRPGNKQLDAVRDVFRFFDVETQKVPEVDNKKLGGGAFANIENGVVLEDDHAIGTTIDDREADKVLEDIL